jgi:hypothetical protein
MPVTMISSSNVTVTVRSGRHTGESSDSFNTTAGRRGRRQRPNPLQSIDEDRKIMIMIMVDEDKVTGQYRLGTVMSTRMKKHKINC